MTTGSPDYWATRENRMNSILSSIAASIAEGGALHTALDSMDGKLDGIIDLTNLSTEQTVLLGNLFSIDTVDGDGRNLLTKLDALDGKIDGKMDLDKMELMSIFYDSGAAKPRLQLAVENLDGTIGTLITKLAELVGIHSDTTAMIDFASEDWNGSVSTIWVLCSDVNVRRNMLRVTNTGGIGLKYSRDGGSTTAGQINPGSSAVFHDSAGVWLRVLSGSTTFDAREEWAT